MDCLTTFTSYKKQPFSEFTLNEDFKKFYYLIGRENLTGRILAQYFTNFKSKFFDEEISVLPHHFPLVQIEEIYKKHHAEMIETFNKIGHHKISGIHFITQFVDYRKNAVEKSKVESQRNRLLFETQNRMMYDHYLLSQFSPKDKNLKFFPQPFVEGSTHYFCDKEWSLEASFSRLLCVKPYSEVFYPHFGDLITNFFLGRSKRKEIIKTLDFYELKYENQLIFRKTAGKTMTFNTHLYQKICEPLKYTQKAFSKLLDTLVDHKFIENAITKGYVPEYCRKQLKKYEGLPLMKALVKTLNWNFKNRDFIVEERRALDFEENGLFSCIENICKKKKHGPSPAFSDDKGNSFGEINKYLKNNNSPLSQGSKKNHAYLKLKAIYKYLTEESDAVSLDLLSSLDFNLEGLSGLLRIVKMFDMVLAAKNSDRFSECFKDLHFYRSSYALRKMIFNKMPGCDSFDIFSKTLFNQRKNEDGYFANPKNWIDERIGLHAKLFANTYILANSLSNRLDYPTIIVGMRGNSGSGKSTAIRKLERIKEMLEGILNTDPIKYSLRKGTDIKNYQIHREGAVLFDSCFNEIAKNTNLSYVIDLRLIRTEDVKTYLLEPAQKRNCVVSLHDLDVPLLTSINRILKRDPKGVDPIPSLEPIKDGFKGIRENRNNVIELVKREVTIGEYYLYYLGKIVAQKKDGIFEIIDERYAESIRVPTEEEINKYLDTIIDERYIVEALQREDLKKDEAHIFNDLMGLSVREALQKRVNQT